MHALEILNKHNMLDSKPCKTSVVLGSKLNKNEGTPLQGVTNYRALVDSLQYLSQMKPELTYVVNQVAQFVQEPKTLYLIAAKRIFKIYQGLKNS